MNRVIVGQHGFRFHLELSIPDTYLTVVAKATAIPIVNGTGYWAAVIWVPAGISAVVLAVNIGYVLFERSIPQHLRVLTGRQAARLHGGGGGFRMELRKSLETITSLPGVFWLFTLTQVGLICRA